MLRATPHPLALGSQYAQAIIAAILFGPEPRNPLDTFVWRASLIVSGAMSGIIAFVAMLMILRQT
jgi:hypothetical protein